LFGFPWILSSESRVINGLRGTKRGRFFLAPSPWRREAPGRERAVDAVRKRSIIHAGKLNLVSDFLQDVVVVRPAPFRPPQSKIRLALGETEVLLAAGRRFADHHSALAQILQMGKGRKAGGTRQGGV
jgi:hypothetical protein